MDFCKCLGDKYECIFFLHDVDSYIGKGLATSSRIVSFGKKSFRL